MKTQLKLALIFLSIFAVSFLPQQFPYVFDWKCNGSGEKVYGDAKDLSSDDYFTGCNYTSNFHHSTWHWGFRHYILLAMGLTFTAINVIKIIQDESKK
jgi:hypothetical protein